MRGAVEIVFQVEEEEVEETLYEQSYNIKELDYIGTKGGFYLVTRPTNGFCM